MENLKEKIEQLEIRLANLEKKVDEISGDVEWKVIDK